jgi:hypothetical protein
MLVNIIARDGPPEELRRKLMVENPRRALDRDASWQCGLDGLRQVPLWEADDPFGITASWHLKLEASAARGSVVTR